MRILPGALEDIERLTIDHYDRNAEPFWSGTRDHHVSQNIKAFLQALPKDVKMFWGYGLYPDRAGNYVKKNMSQCSGEEILEELWYHLKIQKLMKPVVASGKVNCIPVAMPFIDSLFMPCSRGDRPEVLPRGATNFAFLGQFAEVNNDCFFTVEYSVRSAQTAVYGLFECDKGVIPVYDSIHNPKVIIKAMKAISR